MTINRSCKQGFNAPVMLWANVFLLMAVKGVNSATYAYDSFKFDPLSSQLSSNEARQYENTLKSAMEGQNTLSPVAENQKLLNPVVQGENMLAPASEDDNAYDPTVFYENTNPAVVYDKMFKPAITYYNIPEPAGLYQTGAPSFHELSPYDISRYFHLFRNKNHARVKHARTHAGTWKPRTLPWKTRGDMTKARKEGLENPQLKKQWKPYWDAYALNKLDTNQEDVRMKKDSYIGVCSFKVCSYG